MGFLHRPSPARHGHKSTADEVAKYLGDDCHLSARKLAQTVEIVPSQMQRDLPDDLGIKLYHLLCGMPMLINKRRAKHTEMTRAMLTEIVRHKASNFHFRLTGDES
jgi:hypothetical protein